MVWRGNENIDRNAMDEPRREKMGLMTYANSKALGKPAHPRSLARSFAVCFLMKYAFIKLYTKSKTDDTKAE